MGLKSVLVVIMFVSIFMLAINARAEAFPAGARWSDASGNEVQVLGGRPAGCPHAWCGCWLRQYLNVQDKSLNLARQWRTFGAPAGGPAVGVIVVWHHHVGIITGRGADGGWIIKSGNDGRVVRERERSLRGAIAFRWPSAWAMR